MSDHAAARRPVRHIVMWRVAGATAEEKRASMDKVKRGFESLRGVIPGMTHLEIGIDESRISYACDVVLVTEFENAEALDRYATHPEHARVRTALEGLRIDRHQVDYTLSPAGEH
ncbi:hypothetical protein AZL_a08910 (plasmid) [Azospirillum sp. B510]|uniref:Dabb family protein n=1 Tax=Azospirillum sp. (strain B510) TaxID=137722 RepID=UPI0001C4BBB3|nr:Dabb family protein [Azospirillum sp. B510]BAI74422.1 hypothetical protein AZL_a08910 [Azospirillum sp. B510]